MLLIIAQILGFAAVGLYFLSYQLKKRNQIVGAIFISNLFYIAQYILLGAFAGAVMDVLAAAASYLGVKKNTPYFKKNIKWIAPLILLAIVVIGLAIAIIRHKWIELLAVAGTVFQAISLWCDDEQTIRKFSLCSAPFWLIYNFISQAYGAAIGSVFVILSIIVSLIRYRKNKN